MGLPVIQITILSIATILLAVQMRSAKLQVIDEIGVLQTRLGRNILSVDDKVNYVIKPSDTNAVVNGSSTLYCKVTKTSVIWFGPPNYHVRTESRRSGHPRYSVVGGEGEYNLFINPVQQEDEGMFRCWVGMLSGEPAEAMLTVLTQAGAPVITGYSNPVREGDTLTISCTSHGGDPLPTLSWSLSSASLEADPLSTDDNEIRTTLRIKREHNGQVVTCTASQSGYPNLLRPQTTQITLEVQYAPLVSITTTSPEVTKDGTTIQVIEGKTVTIRCNVESNPLSNISWEGPRGVSLPGNEPEVHISAITRNQNGTFTCTATNSIASKAYRTTVEVLYPPKILTTVQHARVTVGDKLTLKCLAEGNPAPTIIWLNSSNSDRLPNPLVIPIAKYSMTGKYICIAGSNRFDRLDEKEVFIEVTGKPVIVSSSNIVHAEVGSGAGLRCNVEVDPPINRSYWSWTESDGNRTILWGNNTKDRFSAYQVISTRGITMLLAIDNIMQIDFRHYKCTAANRIGQDNRTLKLQPRNGIASLSLPLLVGLGCSACVVCLPLVYFIKRYCHLGRTIENNDQVEIDSVELQLLNGATNGHVVRLHSGDVSELSNNLQNHPVRNGTMELQDPSPPQHETSHLDIQRQPEETWQNSDIYAQSESQLLHGNEDIINHDRDRNNHLTASHTRIAANRQDMEFEADQITLLGELGEGQFGKVYKAKAHFVNDYQGSMFVAVKTVKAHASSEVQDDMLKELKMMMRLLDSHPNVVTLLGYCTKSDPVMLVVEYVPNGDLLSFLRKDRTTRNVTYKNLHTESRTLQNTDLISFAWQVSKGMCYLASMQCIHRDLAARNVLVGEHKTCKVSDFGLAREGPEYKKLKDSPLPLRWMAPETLSIERFYTTKSDVWSFGVLLYEIVTLGSTPYPTMTALQAADKVQRGLKLQKPTHCTDDLYFIMENCWHFLPDERPPFSELSAALSRLIMDEKDHIMLNQYDEHQYANLERSAVEVC
ncbi:fibroblast growth factor receptor 4-like [Branchiostoma lanceolatum]|uniref:fibroblast growth factor receptor 4-like n=1 Tax=Branchiostoma lanceolatum TaxID=7740 RepID=UPI00345540AE